MTATKTIIAAAATIYRTPDGRYVAIYSAQPGVSIYVGIGDSEADARGNLSITPIGSEYGHSKGWAWASGEDDDCDFDDLEEVEEDLVEGRFCEAVERAVDRSIRWDKIVDVVGTYVEDRDLEAIEYALSNAPGYVDSESVGTSDEGGLILEAWGYDEDDQSEGDERGTWRVHVTFAGPDSYDEAD